jgi:hypothetical protein
MAYLARGTSEGDVTLADATALIARRIGEFEPWQGDALRAEHRRARRG